MFRKHRKNNWKQNLWKPLDLNCNGVLTVKNYASHFEGIKLIHFQLRRMFVPSFGPFIFAVFETDASTKWMLNSNCCTSSCEGVSRNPRAANEAWLLWLYVNSYGSVTATRVCSHSPWPRMRTARQPPFPPQHSSHGTGRRGYSHSMWPEIIVSATVHSAPATISA